MEQAEDKRLIVAYHSWQWMNLVVNGWVTHEVIDQFAVMVRKPND